MSYPATIPQGSQRQRPILFSAPMVRAILDGRKTQTRRIVKPTVRGCTVGTYRNGAGVVEPVNVEDDGDPWSTISCPFGAPGDRLWVRETWYCDDYRADNVLSPDMPISALAECKDELYFRADGEPDFEASEGKFWRPSIFMPRWASRIDLEVTGVRVERLRQITGADAVAEGITPTMRNERPAVERFADLWDSINGDRASWSTNPWVWVVEFRRVRP